MSGIPTNPDTNTKNNTNNTGNNNQNNRTIRDSLTNYYDSLWRQYFADTITTTGTSLAELGLYALGVCITLAFFTAAFTPLPQTLAFTGIGIFLLSFAAHTALWFTGIVYRNGITGTITLTLETTVILVFGIIGGAALLYGWAVPMFAAVEAYNTLLPGRTGEILMPFFLLAIIAFVGAWVIKAFSLLEN